MGVGDQPHAPAALPPGKTLYQLWAPGPVGTGAKNLTPPPAGFDPRTVQPVASRYTDCAVPAAI